jgi:ribosome biogenesis GTPase / thiamine phosphate phosphatase
MLYPLPVFTISNRMGKRRLTLQQQRRIADQQRRKQVHADPADDTQNLSDPMEGRVIARFGKQVEIASYRENPQEPRIRCFIRANITDITTGDHVIFRRGPGTGIVESVLPRRSLMARPDNSGNLRPLAANVDLMTIVFAPRPEAHQNLIDRYLVAAVSLGITPLLVCNKIDLVEQSPGSVRELIDLYAQLNVPVIEVSTKRQTGLDQLQSALTNKTTVLVGQSGVGKSSILNSLIPDASAQIGDLSQVAKGRHTTTKSQYYNLPFGGGLIDSPGIREFGLWHMSPRDVAAGFSEFRPLLGTCRFRDCQHQNEPGCAVLEAVETGIIDRRRYTSFAQIVRDLSNPR